MTDLLAQKRIDADSIASEIDAKLLRTASAIREKHEITPTIIEVAYGHYDFEIAEDYIADCVGLARAVGINYEIESVGTSNSKLSSRMETLSEDPSIHGIRVSGWRLHRGEDTYQFNELAPTKDIDCKTPRCLFELLTGSSMYSEPSAGAISRLIGSVVAGQSPAETTIAVLGQLHDPVIRILAASNHFGTIIKSGSICSENIDLVRQADVIVTSCGIDRGALRQGQIIVDRSGRWDSRDVPADLIEMLPLVRAFATWRAIFTLARRVRFINLLRGIISRQIGLDPRSSSDLDNLLR